MLSENFDHFFTYDYRYSNTRKSWYDAKSSCESIGSQLIEPRTKEINDDIAAEAFDLYQGTLDYWMGISDEAEEGNWIYNSDGQSITFSNWLPGWPGQADCAFTYGSGGSDHGKWRDSSCSTTFYYICSPAISTTTTTTTPTTVVQEIDYDLQIIGCSASDNQGGFHCSEAYDGTTDNRDNGWAYGGGSGAWVIFELAEKGTMNSLRLISGQQRGDHRLIKFKVK